MSIAEQMFDNMVKDEGWSVHIAGWPDRWIEKDGTVIFVEVKSRNGALMPQQIETLQMMESLGLAVRIYCGSGGLEDTVTVTEFLSGEGARLFKPLGPQAIYNYRTEIRKLQEYAQTLPEGLRKEQIRDLIKRREAMLPKPIEGKSHEEIQRNIEERRKAKMADLEARNPEFRKLRYNPKTDETLTLRDDPEFRDIAEQEMMERSARKIQQDLDRARFEEIERKQPTSKEEAQAMLDELDRLMKGGTLNEGYVDKPQGGGNDEGLKSATDDAGEVTGTDRTS